MKNSCKNRCIFCLRTDRSFKKNAHIIPESAGNEKLVLPKGFECDDCNEGFSVIEQQVLRSLPGQIFRVAFLDKTKRGSPPTADIKGGKIKRIPSTERPAIQIRQHSKNPNAGKFTIEQNASMITWKAQTLSGRKISALLAKMSLEYFCLKKINVYTKEYDNLRYCAKTYGRSPFISFFVGLHVQPTQAVEIICDNKQIGESLRPVWIRFPGLSAVIPTMNSIQDSSLELLRSFIARELPGQFLLISDPNWENPINVNLTLTPVTKIAKKSIHKALQEFNNDKT